MQSSEVIQVVEKYVRTCRCDYAQWAVGLAADPIERLLGHHGVAEEGDGCGWISYQCASVDAARAAMAHFTGLGMKSASSDADATTTAVYVFKITSTTRC